MVDLRVLISIAVLAGCGPGTHAPVAPAPAPVAAAAAAAAEVEVEEVDPEAPDLRLPAGVRPTGYDVDLTIDPASEDVTGTITIAVALDAPTRALWLNADEIAVDSARVTAGGAELAARVIETPADFLGLALPRAIGPGPATVTIRYRAKAHPGDGDGITPWKRAVTGTRSPRSRPPTRAPRSRASTGPRLRGPGALPSTDQHAVLPPGHGRNLDRLRFVGRPLSRLDG